MLAVQMLEAQLSRVNTILHDVTDDLTEAEWTTRALPGTNLLAFEVWHMVRAQDWAVHTMMLGVPEVISDPIWSGRGGLTTPGLGVGFSQAQADELARAVRRQDVVAYADAVHERIIAWLDTISDDELEQVSDVAAHIEPHPVYQEPALRETAPWLFEGVPAWHFLTRSCIAHAHGHLTEADLLKRQLRR